MCAAFGRGGKTTPPPPARTVEPVFAAGRAQPPALVELGVAAGAVLGSGAAGPDGGAAGVGVAPGAASPDAAGLVSADDDAGADDEDEGAEDEDDTETSACCFAPPGHGQPGGVPVTMNVSLTGGCGVGSAPGTGVCPQVTVIVAVNAWLPELVLSARNAMIWHPPGASR